MRPLGATELFSQLWRSRSVFSHVATLNVTGNVDSRAETATITTVDVVNIYWNSQWQIMLINPTAPNAILCGKAYHNTTVINGHLDFSNTSEILLTASNGGEKVKYDFKDFRNFTVEIFNANNNTVIPRCLYRRFEDVSDEDAVARALYTAPTVSLAMESIAPSMSTQIREGQNATSFHGTAIQRETYIHVTGVWLVLPIAVVLLGIVLLVLIVMVTQCGEKL
ncbi:hypothetical protein IFR04_008779 [Cadophora malorum]|uniref:Uncharacterized protein n=1 Tax=Cadophora malorum TaxID=108018 RepID=A0A8H7TFZ9_9HELO|nr:hypothetical protein IFR04_008779 [Cadophora malorum]